MHAVKEVSEHHNMHAVKALSEHYNMHFRRPPVGQLPLRHVAVTVMAIQLHRLLHAHPIIGAVASSGRPGADEADGGSSNCRPRQAGWGRAAGAGRLPGKPREVPG